MERLITSDCPLEQGMAAIVRTYRTTALVAAIKALEQHRQLMAKLYGDKAMREYDTCKYLDGIKARMKVVDHDRMNTLSERRALLTRLCTEEEIEQAIDMAK